MKLVLAAVLMVGSCVTMPDPKPDDPVTPDPGTTDPPPKPRAATCADACARGTELRAGGDPGCEWALGSLGPDREPGTGDEASCVEVCEDQGAALGAFPVECIVSQVSCEGVSECFQ